MPFFPSALPFLPSVLALLNTLIGIAILAMPKNCNIHQQPDGAPGAYRTPPPSHLSLPLRQVMHRDAKKFKSPMHQQEDHQMHSTKATPEEAQKTAKGTAIETTPEEPGTPNAKGTAKTTTPPADRATKRQAAIIYYKAFSFPAVKSKKETAITGGSVCLCVHQSSLWLWYFSPYFISRFYPL